MLAVDFQRITKVYHHQTVLKNISFKIEAGKFAVIFGPPGCGKSIILRLLAGLEKPTSGRIYMRGEDVTDIPPGERGIGYVPQSFALYPHYKVYDNIAYPLRLMGVHKAELDPVVRQAAEMLRIDLLLNKFPDQLSGGEKQRVALARGVTKKTEIFVFDDPLSGLDFKLREQLIDDLRQMQQSLGATFVYTTSDSLETFMLAEQVHILDNGKIIEAGSLEEVYSKPMHIRTMRLLGFPEANILSGRLFVREDKTWCQTSLFEFPVNLTQHDHRIEGQNVAVAVRPHDIILNPEKTNSLVEFQALIVLKEDLGGELVVHLDAEGIRLLSVVRQDDVHLLADDEITVGVQPNKMVLYSGDEGHRIGQGGN
ncbi:Maltose/maltodextrin import ATP-binding protein MalK [subsurface metagenome]